MFLRRLVNDANADKILTEYMNQFILQSPLVESRAVFRRLRRRMAAIYAGMALAIDYKILPFYKEPALQDVRKCMNDAIDLLIKHEKAAIGFAAPNFSDDELVTDFRKRLDAATFVKAGRSADRKKPLTTADIEAADGAVKYYQPGKLRAWIRTRTIRRWYPNQPIRNRLVSLLLAVTSSHPAGAQGPVAWPMQQPIR